MLQPASPLIRIAPDLGPSAFLVLCVVVAALGRIWGGGGEGGKMFISTLAVNPSQGYQLMGPQWVDPAFRAPVHTRMGDSRPRERPGDD
jgi:hypothetical protein